MEWRFPDEPSKFTSLSGFASSSKKRMLSRLKDWLIGRLAFSCRSTNSRSSLRIYRQYLSSSPMFVCPEFSLARAAMCRRVAPWDWGH
jgi:hypothetical protein